MRNFDLQIFYWINNWPDGLSPFFIFLSEGNKWLGVRLTLLSFLIYCFTQPKLRTPAILGLVSWPIANELCDLLKNGLMMPRPSVELADAIIRVNKLTSFGTASAHSANMAAIAAVFTWYTPKVGYFWIGIAFFTGLSRIYVGVHYPYQVLFGWFVGTAVSLTFIALWELWKKKSARLKDEPIDEMPENSQV